MARKRFATKKEALAYPVLQKMTEGSMFRYNTERFDWRKAYTAKYGPYRQVNGQTYSWRDWHSESGLLGYANQDCLNLFQEMPELQPKFEEMFKHLKIAEEAIFNYENIRLALVEEMRKTFAWHIDSTNYDTEFEVMTPELEATWKELKGSPSKITALRNLLSELEAELALIGKGVRDPRRKALQDEIDKVKTQLRTVGIV